MHTPLIRFARKSDAKREMDAKDVQKQKDRNMILTASEKIVCDVSDEKQQEILDNLEEQFKKVSIRCMSDRRGESLTVESISASFGSILRKDITNVIVSETKKHDGYTISAETQYKPSTAFWIFCVIDLLLICTVVGLIIGFGLTLGLYFYNKSLVSKTLTDTLKRVKDEME